MKNFYLKILTISFFGIVLSACEYDEDEILQGYEPAALPVVSDITSPFFDLIDLDNANIGFTLDKKGVPVNSIIVQKTFKEQTVNHAEISSFPAKLNISVDEALAGFQGVTKEDLAVGDAILFSFLVKTADGRSFYSAENVNAPFSCESDLEGTFSFATTVTAVGEGGDMGGCSNPVTGTGSLTALGAGRYSISDATFGVYDCAWGDSPAAGVVLIDVCNEISTGGSDQYGLVYTFDIVSNDGTSLEILWENDYGDKGRSILTRTDEKIWPEGLFN